MAKAKTTLNEASVEDFLGSIEGAAKRDDSQKICQMMQEITGKPAKMWGKSIIGFGTYHYKYESGREGDSFLVGFSPRKQNITLYIMSGFGQYGALMDQLGKYKTGKSCLYINKLADVDENILRQLIKDSADYIAQKYQ